MNISTRKPVRLVLAVMLAFACAGLQAAELAGVRLDDAVRVANQDLRLNGAGIRYKAVFKVYVAGLYLPEKKTSASAVMSAAGARRVSITMLRDVSNEEFGRGFMSGITQNSDRAETGRMVTQLQKFGEIFASIPELKKGDLLNVDWVPGAGTMVYLNGKRISEVLPDLAFYNAILKIWLGDKPIDSGLKPALLGLSEDEARGRGNS